MFGITFAFCISIVLPIAAFVYACIKKRYIPFLLGIIAFTVSQLILRLPILKLLQDHSSTFLTFKALQPVTFALVLGLSAGLFENLGRFVLIRFLMKQRDWKSGFLFGIGHGGIEAILFVGIIAFTMMFAPVTSIYNADFFVAGIERFFAILLHVGLSIIVLQAVVQKRFVYVLIAIFIHGFVDTLVGVFPLFLSPTSALIAIEVSAAIIAIGVFTYSLIIKRKGILT